MHVHEGGSGTFVLDVLSLWVIAEAPVHGWKTGGKQCADVIVKPVLLWWTGEGEFNVHPKYRAPALALIDKLDEVAWDLFGDMRSIKKLHETP